MVRLATSIIAITLLAIPALAVSSEQYERSVSESDLYGRSIIDGDDIIVTREDLIDIYGRDFVNDIEERSPFGLGLLFKGIKAAVKIGKGAHKAHEAKEHAQNSYNKHHRREFNEDEELVLRELYDELDERSPFGLGLLFKGIKAAVKIGKGAHKAHEAKEHAQNSYNKHHRRELDDEVYEREFDDEDMFEREFEDEDLLEREYFDDLD